MSYAIMGKVTIAIAFFIMGVIVSRWAYGPVIDTTLAMAQTSIKAEKESYIEIAKYRILLSRCAIDNATKKWREYKNANMQKKWSRTDGPTGKKSP